jgi:hypothetical protein
MSDKPEISGRDQEQPEELDRIPPVGTTQPLPNIPALKKTADLNFEPYDLNRHREEVREVLAKRLVVLLCAVIGVGGFAFLFMAMRALALDVQIDTKVQALVTFFNVLLTPVVGIVGTVVGFYYGTASSSGPSDKDNS